MNKAFDPIDIFFIVVILVYFVCLISFIVIFVQKYYDFDKPKDDAIEKVKAIDKKSIKSFILSKKEDKKKTNKTKAPAKNKKTNTKTESQMKKVPKKNTSTKKKRPNKTQSKKNVKRNYKSNVSYVKNNPKRKGTSK